MSILINELVAVSGLIAIIALIGVWRDHRTERKRKDNIRLPRETSWDRVAKWRARG